MDNAEATALFALTLAAMQSDTDDGSAETGLIESTEPTTATCTVERTE